MDGGAGGVRGSSDDRWGLGVALSEPDDGSDVARRPGRALRDAQRSAELFRELGDSWGGLQASVRARHVAEITGDYAQAARQHREGLRVAEDLGLWAEVSYKRPGWAGSRC